MQIKVCGLNDYKNIKDVISLKPDYIGFIFYEGSKRYLENHLSENVLNQIPKSVKKVGVFVNESIDIVEDRYTQYKLDLVQLHGDESPEYCTSLALKGIPVIKAFSVDEQFDFNFLTDYAFSCEYFLFDTKGLLKGGNGVKFNWELLKNYDLEVPFFLSGGIDFNDFESIKELDHDMLHSIDVNSKFEICPGIKDVQKLRLFIEDIKTIKQLII